MKFRHLIGIRIYRNRRLGDQAWQKPDRKGGCTVRNNFPLAYLNTVRCYRTWLHGDERLSVDRHNSTTYGSDRRHKNERLESVMRQNMTQCAVVLNARQRAAVKEAIKEVCNYREYSLAAVKRLD